MSNQERTFVDQARVHVQGGDGGSGIAAFQREPYRPKGKPNGGSGGRGGSIIFRADPNVSSLAELARNPHQRATGGKPGSGTDKNGADGEDRLVLVPDGTEVREGDEVIADLVGAGSEFVAARGGRGGRGNAALASNRRKAPAFFERGEAGEERWLTLELKMLADVGLVGFPSAGKSSLIARLSAARPKIAAYPFTTLTPNLGVAETADARFVVADVPGLIEGASEGRGLGLEFLRHLERCRVLCFVVDVAAPEEPVYALDILRAELRAHDPSFDARIGVVAANKIDVSGVDAHVEQAKEVALAAGFGFVAVSALRGDGIDRLQDLLSDAVSRARAAEPERVSHRLIRLRPGEETVEVSRENDGWRVRSSRAEHLLSRFDVNDREALSYIQERLIAYGVESALLKAGAREGDDVRIGDLVFEFEPEEAPAR